MHLLSKLYSPDPRPSTKVQYTLKIPANRCKMKSSTKDKEVDMMQEVDPVLFFFVVGLAIKVNLLSHSCEGLEQTE